MDRTITVQLKPTPEQARSLKATFEQHTACFNVVAREGFMTACSNGVELHKRTYYPLRAQYPDLPAQLVCAARVKATEAVKSALTWKVKQEQAYPKRLRKPRNWASPFLLSSRFVALTVRWPVSAMTSVRTGSSGTRSPVALPP